MTKRARKIIGSLLILFGLVVTVSSPRIVFPGLERLVGIETIVGRENVIYEPDGSYIFTNPGAMVRWIVSVAAVGIAIAATGAFMLLRKR
jgi:hypothetical protein